MTASRVLRKKCIGEDVKNAQQLLIRAGYGELLGSHQDDAVFGPDTKHSVEQFQRDHNLTDDGVIGPLTFHALEAAAAKKTASKLPADAAKKLENIKASSSVSGSRTPKKEPFNAPDETTPSPIRVMNEGEIRLAQSYLRVMNYFGPMDDVVGISVVHGNLDKRTRAAFDQFAKDHGKEFNLTSGAPTAALFNAITEYGQSLQIKGTPATSRDSNLVAEVQRSALAREFETHKAELGKSFANKTEFGKNFAKVETVHPVMRFPMMKAMQELESKHIRVSIREAYRPPEEQIKHVMNGHSTAPPGYSFHSSGLAFDIYPLDAKGKVITNTKNPAWDKIYDVMEKYGFYSMMRDPLQKWDAPHHELPAKTGAMVTWKKGSDGWKDIPESALPAEWLRINKQALDASQSEAYTLPAKTREVAPRQK